MVVDLSFKYSTITSSANPKIKLIKKLKSKRARDQEELFIIEGYRELLRASEAQVAVQTVFFNEELFLKSNEVTLLKKLASTGAELIHTKKSVLEELSYRDRCDGLIALAEVFSTSLEPFSNFLKQFENPLIALVESIEKPGNLGAILRSADAAGVSCVIVADPKTDVFNPNVVRSSVGTLFTNTIFTGSSEELYALFNKHQLPVIASTPHTDTIYTDLDFQGPVVIALGTEQIGLTDFWLEKATLKAKIPMQGHADSLNVANAASLFFFEVVRQRGIKAS